MKKIERLPPFSYGQHSAWRRVSTGGSSHETDLFTNESEVETGRSDYERRLAGWTKTMTKGWISRISGEDDGTRYNLYACASEMKLKVAHSHQNRQRSQHSFSEGDPTRCPRRRIFHPLLRVCNYSTMWPPFVLDERVERCLVLNSSRELTELVQMVSNIARKILDNPDEVKYRQLRSGSKALSTKVLSRPGGRELLTFAGFHSVKSADATIRFEESIEHLSRVFSWLDSFEPRNCDVELSIRLPSGTSTRAGFVKRETVGDVLAYARRYFVGSTEVVLRTTMPPKKFEDSNADLDQAGLAPRSAVVLAAVGATRDAEAAMECARLQGLELQARERRERALKQREIRSQKQASKQDAIKAREDAIRNFRTDREEKLEQIERHRRTLQQPNVEDNLLPVQAKAYEPSSSSGEYASGGNEDPI